MIPARDRYTSTAAYFGAVPDLRCYHPANSTTVRLTALSDEGRAALNELNRLGVFVRAEGDSVWVPPDELSDVANELLAQGLTFQRPN